MIKNIQRFVVDFVGVFIIAAGSVLVMLCELTTQTMYALQKLWHNVVVPNVTEAVADLRFISCIIWQSMLCIVASSCLFMSKMFLAMAQKTHSESERLVHELWMH